MEATEQSTFGMSSGLYHIAANCAVNSLITIAAAGLTIAVKRATSVLVKMKNENERRVN